ncbi:MAG TPA: MarR family winged helix-turn-helix transcriptional regulator [Hyphomicrobiaceae bacterium]|nr:MarR family winged helix-turn-helix transcriptional regulator [Hyphomicrobiaceae bacterium]
MPKHSQIAEAIGTERDATRKSPRAARASRASAKARLPAHLARSFNQVCLGITAEVTQSVGLTPIEFSVIACLADEPDTGQSGLAARLGMDPVNAHHIVYRLEGAGLVERLLNPADRRAHVLRLTEAGRAIHDRTRPAAHEAQERILSPLAPEERPVLLDLLARLVGAHESYARPGSGRRRPNQPLAPALARSIRQAT